MTFKARQQNKHYQHYAIRVSNCLPHNLKVMTNHWSGWIGYKYILRGVSIRNLFEPCATIIHAIKRMLLSIRSDISSDLVILKTDV